MVSMTDNLEQEAWTLPKPKQRLMSAAMPQVLCERNWERAVHRIMRERWT